MNEQAQTLGQVFRDSCQTYADKDAIRVPESGGYRSITYRALSEIVRGYCAALRELGLQKGDKLAIQSENCLEWAATDWACQCLGVVLVPIYPSLTADQARFIVEDCGAKVVLAGSPELVDRTKDIPGVTQLQLREGEGALAGRSRRETLTEADWNLAIDSVAISDIATIIYTSGTTGNPKGAVLPHRAPVTLCQNIISSLPIRSTDTFFSFLPLSHVFERFAGHWLPISCGATIAYAKSMASLAADIQAAQPTIVLCVPRFLEAMQDRISDGVKKQSGLNQKLFALAVSQGAKKAEGKFAPLFAITESVVGKKVRARLGGHIRFLVSGGAALAPHTYAFFKSFGLEVNQGYGLTETCAGSCLNPIGRNRPGTVGTPIQGVEVKIAEDGEILIRGASVMDGYFNLPEETDKAIDGEGWFHTGDIGIWDEGYLKITDRKKDILVLANGKNIAPQPIENLLKESAFISEAVLFGDGNEFVYGLIIPNFERLKEHLQEQGLKAGSNSEIVELDVVQKLMKSEIDVVNKRLADFERVKRYVLLDAVLSIESGELTPSYKVKRKVVREKFSDQLNTLMR